MNMILVSVQYCTIVLCKLSECRLRCSKPAKEPLQIRIKRLRMGHVFLECWFLSTNRVLLVQATEDGKYCGQQGNDVSGVDWGWG